MRIAVLTNSIPSPKVTGGAGRIAYLYNELLRARGHIVRVWGPNSTFEQLRSMHPLSRLVFHLMDLGSNDVTTHEITAWKPDLLLTHNFTGCGFGTPTAVKAKGIRWMHFLHDVQLIEPSGQIRVSEQCVEGRGQLLRTAHRVLLTLFNALWRRGWSFLRRQAMVDPDAVASPTRWLLKFHQNYGWFCCIKTAIIPNPIRPHPQPLSFARRGETVLYVGRVDEDKGMLVLLKAWKKMTRPDVRLVVIGDGTLLEHLRMQHIPRVEFRGVQSPEGVCRAMEESAVVVVPSLVLENQPTVILEALAAGCNVVASDVGGVAETLDGAGMLVPPGDVEALAQAMTEVVSSGQRTVDSKKREAMLFHHDPQHCVEALERLIDIKFINPHGSA